MLMLLWMVSFGSAVAQSNEPDIQLRLRRTFGYQGGNKIQGSFSLQITGEENIASVDYLIDGEVLATVNESPYKVTFSTSGYLPGEHALQAVATKTDGELLHSQIIRLAFITAEESWRSAGRLAAWIL